MRFKHHIEDDHVVMVMSGDVMGGPTYEKLRDEVEALIAEGHRHFLFDYSKVRWINSSGIGIMVSIHLMLDAVGGRLVICGANKRVRGTYYVNQLDRIFKTLDDFDQGRRFLVDEELEAVS